MRIARDLLADGIISAPTAVERLSGLDLETIEHRELIVPAGLQPIAHAVSAGAGVAVGAAVFDPARVKEVKNGASALLLRENAETADIAAIAEADALITARGARTSHAAVVARQLGKVCLVACGALQIDASGRSGRLGEVTVREGDILSIDGASGCIYPGELAIRRARPTELLSEIKNWTERQAASADVAMGRRATGSKEDAALPPGRTNPRPRKATGAAKR
ncbi:MAG: PEP-utilizing enzyme [Hyphomicrobium sp.]